MLRGGSSATHLLLGTMVPEGRLLSEAVNQEGLVSLKAAVGTVQESLVDERELQEAPCAWGSCR